jgi:hypothetical protein
VTLDQDDVREQAYKVLLSWAQAAHQEEIDKDVAFSILAEVRNLHTPVDAMSRFLYGSPDYEDPGVIDARLALANLRSCSHCPCDHPECPIRTKDEFIKDTEAPVLQEGQDEKE